MKRNGKREPRHSLLAPRNRTEKERAKERERARDARPNERDKERTPQGTKRNAVTEGTEGKRKKKETGKGPKRDFLFGITFIQELASSFLFLFFVLPFLSLYFFSLFFLGFIKRGQEGKEVFLGILFLYFLLLSSFCPGLFYFILLLLLVCIFLFH